MTIYIDEIRTFQHLSKPGMRVKLGKGKDITKWCHIATDSADLEELHVFVEEHLGLKREWFNDHPSHPHYDVSISKRPAAIKGGAVEIDSHELIRRCSLIFNKELAKARKELYGDKVYTPGKVQL